MDASRIADEDLAFLMFYIAAVRDDVDMHAIAGIFEGFRMPTSPQDPHTSPARGLLERGQDDDAGEAEQVHRSRVALLRMGLSRLGSLTESQDAALARVGTAALQRCFERILTATTVEEVLVELNTP